MVHPFRRRSLSAALLLLSCVPAFGATWTQPTPDELKMTVDPAAPDAPAVYLLRDEFVNEKDHYHRVYARIKILTEKGKEEYSDVEIPYEQGVNSVAGVEGRTIHADGTVVPFTGKPYQKELLKAGGVKIMAKVFSMPDVQVGSILEYRYELQYEDYWYSPAHWLIQQPIYVHKAHYRFIPPAIDLSEIRNVDAFGKDAPVTRLLYLAELPAGTQPTEDVNGYELTVENVPPIPDEEYSPPLSSFSERVFFYYASSFTGEDYWKNEGKEWSKDVDRFAAPSDTLREALNSLLAPSDTDVQKLQKIYTAVMGIENTSFTREHTAAENKAEGLRVKTAADVWNQKRGTDDEINRLFIAMARMAGLKADAMIVTRRNRNFLNMGYLEWSQLEDEIAIVTVGGKEMYFDPGERYCEFGHLHWSHEEVQGMRQSDKGPVFAVTPGSNYHDNEVVRTAELNLAADGKVRGIVRVSMKGVEALRWRQLALTTDEDAVKKQFEDEMQERVPDGVIVRTNHFLGLTDPDAQLMAVMDVSGGMGTATGKRVFLPGAFFEARVKPLFAETKRQNPVDLHYPYVALDQVKVTLAPGLKVEGVPASAKIPMKQLAIFQEVYGSKDNVYQQGRQMALGTPLFKPDEYAELRDFFQKASAQDQQPIVLDRVPVTAAPAGGAQ